MSNIQYHSYWLTKLVWKYICHETLISSNFKLIIVKFGMWHNVSCLYLRQSDVKVIERTQYWGIWMDGHMDLWTGLFLYMPPDSLYNVGYNNCSVQTLWGITLGHPFKVKVLSLIQTLRTLQGYRYSNEFLRLMAANTCRLTNTSLYNIYQKYLYTRQK